MPHAEKMLEMKVANKRMKSKPDFDIPKLPKKKYPAQRIQDQKRPYHAGIVTALPIPRSKAQQKALLKPSKVRTSDRGLPTPAGTKFEDGSVQPGPDMPKRPKAKVRKKKIIKFTASPTNRSLGLEVLASANAPKPKSAKKLYGR